MKYITSAILSGVSANRCLVSERRGHVLASLTKALYLRDEGGEIFWISEDSVPMHRRCARLSEPPPRCEADATYQIVDRKLRVDKSCEIELRDIHVWCEPLVTSSYPGGARKLADRIEALFDRVDVAESRNFGRFIPILGAHLFGVFETAGAEGYFLPADLADSTLDRAGRLITEFSRACHGSNTSKIALLSQSLVGLGAGLTPSGDDFLGGFLFTITRMGKFPLSHKWVKPRVNVRDFSRRTNEISFTLLRDMAKGHGIAPLYGIVDGLCGDVPFERIDDEVGRLVAVGHSSGWDMLSGVFAGLLYVYHGSLVQSTVDT
jgi:hypothetical protein